MKIGDLDCAHAIAPATKGRGACSQKPTGMPPQASAQVALCGAVSLLSMPEFDVDRVARVAQATREGKFQIHHEAIADRLIANAREAAGQGLVALIPRPARHAAGSTNLCPCIHA
jgi:negative regulator of flagellin synthesis FlgM